MVMFAYIVWKKGPAKVTMCTINFVPTAIQDTFLFPTYDQRYEVQFRELENWYIAVTKA